MAKEIDEHRVQAWMDGSPFIRFLGLVCTAVDLDAQEVRMRMPMRPELERGEGTNQFHGGPIASFIDTVGDFAIAVVVGGGVPTVNFRVDYIRPCFGPHLDAVARVRRVGRTVGIADIDVLGADGKLVAVGRGCYGTQVG
ncbi:MAG: PaaI family thioesterase [Alphaproteobacteria bacterium]|nr:PaaI family thioesterase [Alphaproteobacteria bacterium]